MRIILAAMLVLLSVTATEAQDRTDPTPQSVDEFRLAVQKVLADTGVPGAGIALVRAGGIEWAGGIRLADRDRNIPVTADTHFRAGSISKTFIAIALVQMYLDGDIDMETPVAAIASEIPIDNAWEHTDPVRVIHLLQHTAGFDDMHFNEMYNVSGPPELPLATVLKLNPSSRTVRWKPGTRMSYSNPGYTVAAYLIEKITGQKYEERIAERIFKPVGMPTSSFHLTKEDEAMLARGYNARTGPPVAFTPIYLRPSGNLHTSARELGNFVQMLLNWGETERDLVVDPEYLSNMEHPRTTIASQFGLRTGYGSGISSFSVDGFPMLGHAGGIDGFLSQYAYSTSRDIGFVVLLNSTHSPEAMRRIQQLAVRYLKKDVAAPEKPKASVSQSTLKNYEGYYHDNNPRNQVVAFLEWLLSGRTVTVEGDHLRVTPVFGSSETLIPVSDTLFRFEQEPEPTRVFVSGDAGEMILTGGATYAERWPRWRIESVRWAVLGSAIVVLTPLVMLIPWIVFARRVSPPMHQLKAALLLCAIGFVLPVIGIIEVNDHTIGSVNVWTALMFAGSILLPLAAVVSFLYAIDALRSGARRALTAYALVVSLAALVISGYLSAWGMIAFRPWHY